MNWSRWITIRSYPHGTTKEKVSEVFERFGPLEHVAFGKSKYAMVKFVNESDAEKAIEYFGKAVRLPEEKGFRIRKTEDFEADKSHGKDMEHAIRRILETSFNNYREAKLKKNEDCLTYDDLLNILRKIPYELAEPWKDPAFIKEMKNLHIPSSNTGS